MRPGTVDLLRIRDGEPVDVSVRAAVDADPTLKAELAELAATRAALEALPALSPPPGAWPRIAARLSRPPAPSRGRWQRWQRWPLRAAIAAGVAVASLWIVARLGDGAGPGAPADIVAGGAAPAQPLLGTPAYASLVQESARLERALDGLDFEPRVVRVGTAATIASLEDRIAAIDEQLTFARALNLSPAQRHTLLRQRVELLSALVQVRYAEARRFTF